MSNGIVRKRIKKYRKKYEDVKSVEEVFKSINKGTKNKGY